MIGMSKMASKEHGEGKPRWSYPRHKEFRKELECAASSWFSDNKKPVGNKAPYILASHKDWPENIILPGVAEYELSEQASRSERGEGFPLHRWIHHGLSSQAMLFNLVGPLILSKDFEPLRETLTAFDIPWPKGDVVVRFEIEDREVFCEWQVQPTSIDLAIEGVPESHAIFIEAKMVEQEFGGCSIFSDGDCDGQNPASDHSLCYLHHIGRSYWERLDEFGFLVGPMKDSPVCLLAQYYQFFREILFTFVKDGYFILLVDRRNPTFSREGDHGTRGLFPFLISFVPEEHRDRIRLVTVQDLLKSIQDSGRHNDWLGEFRSKYGIYVV